MSDKPPPYSVLCAGRLYCDLVFTGVSDMPVMGTETFSKGLSLHAGGGAFITSAAFSALGWKAALLTTFPAPPFEDIVRKDIASCEVNIDLCKVASDGSAPQITVAIAGPTDRAFLSNKAGPSLPDAVLPKGIYRHLHIGELRSLCEHPDLIAKARGAGMTISVDCGWDADLLQQGAELAELLLQVDIFLPNQEEYKRLISSGLPEAASPLTVVKCGSDGSRAFNEGVWTKQPTREVRAVDATGAGDAFNGGFLSSWLMGKTLDKCLSDGNLCGRCAVQHEGGTGGLLALQNELGAAKLGAAE